LHIEISRMAERAAPSLIADLGELDHDPLLGQSAYFGKLVQIDDGLARVDFRKFRS
jgi:hypothetical protein